MNPKNRKHWLSAAAFLTAALTLSCSLLTRTVSQPLQLLQPGAPLGRIAYSGTDGNIYTIDREGKHPTAITQDGRANRGGGISERIYQYPTWAPNGRSLAFVGFSGPPQTEIQASLYTAASDGKNLVSAFNSQADFPFYLFWSPDSNSVTFLTNDISGSRLALQVADAAGGKSQFIGTGQPFYWDWSPDNQAIFVHIGGATANNPDARVAIYELGGALQKKELALKPGSFQAPAWSPDGKELLLASDNGAGGEELVLASRAGDVKQVLAQMPGPVAFAWSPNGARIAYATTPEGNPSGIFNLLTLLDPARPKEGKDVTRGAVVAFFWSPDSQKVAYFVPDLIQPTAVSPNSTQSGPKLSLQAQVYDMARGDTKQVAVFEPTDAFLQVIPFFDQYQRSGTIWSPDSKNLVLPVIDQNGDSKIMVVDVAKGQLRPVADGDLAFWSWK
jgi:Tol biopolymer transport system component